MKNYINNEPIRVQSVVFPKDNLSFNEWAERLNVSSMYQEPTISSGHYYTPIEKKKSLFEKLFS